MTQEERIAPLTLIIGTEGNFKLASASKGCGHRECATGRFLGVVGFLGSIIFRVDGNFPSTLF